MRNKQTEEERARQEIDEIEKVQRIGDLRAVLGTPAGKRVIWWLLSYCRVFVSNFHGNSRDAFEAGERSVGVKLLSAILEVDPKLMGQMSQSHSAKQKQIKDRMEELRNG